MLWTRRDCSGRLGGAQYEPVARREGRKSRELRVLNKELVASALPLQQLSGFSEFAMVSEVAGVDQET